MTFTEKLNPQVLFLGRREETVRSAVESLAQEGFVQRLWRKDPTAWRGDEQRQQSVQRSLGWLDVAEKLPERRGKASGKLDVHADETLDQIQHHLPPHPGCGVLACSRRPPMVLLSPQLWMLL